MTNQQNPRDQKEPKLPTHDVKTRRANGEKVTYERIGAGWLRDDGSVYIKLHGTQIVSDGFTLYPVDDAR